MPVLRDDGKALPNFALFRREGKDYLSMIRQRLKSRLIGHHSTSRHAE